jgi:hypothetical protein
MGAERAGKVGGLPTGAPLPVTVGEADETFAQQKEPFGRQEEIAKRSGCVGDWEGGAGLAGGRHDVVCRLVAVGDEVQGAGEWIMLRVSADPSSSAGEVDTKGRGELLVELVGEGTRTQREGPASEPDDVGGDAVGRRG